MADYRKPIPKTQKEISDSQIAPYDKAGLGNPNDATLDPLNNRALQFSFKGDTVKPFSIGIQDIDEAIVYYFNNIIKPYVIQNGERISVPIIYGNAERWKAVQKDGYYRDATGKIMMPILMFKRNNITKNRTIANKLDSNTPHLYSAFKKNYSKRNFYSNFNVLNNTVPENEFYAIVMPDYVTVNYSCIVSTYYVEQLNKIIEAINYASDSYWGDPSRFKFRAMIDSFNTIQEITDGDERSVKTTFDIKLNGYIIPDVLQKDITAIKKIPSVSKIVFSLEMVDGSSETFNATSNQSLIKNSKVNVVSSNNIINNIGGTATVDPAILTYLNTNLEKTATSVPTTATAIFSANFLTAPTGLTTTSMTNFIFFINGQLIENAALTSFTNTPTGTCTLTIDTTQLGFILKNTDEVVAIGKFA
jgi:hypothetical protein